MLDKALNYVIEKNLSTFKIEKASGPPNFFQNNNNV